jgi:hypothetical protein
MRLARTMVSSVKLPVLSGMGERVEQYLSPPSVLAGLGSVDSLRGAAASGNSTEVLVLPAPPSSSLKMMAGVKGLGPSARGLECH